MPTTAAPATYQLEELLEQLRGRGRPYHEFLRQDSISAGIYQLGAGEPDRQQPHTEDELYYVLAGEGAIEVNDTVTPVRQGSAIFVPKHARHHFRDFANGLTLLVIFAPAQAQP